uniref:acylphosphatase-1 isoform X2 n=1 Tax=Myxine glutinosa TaxID=7769 RepID=UPI00358DF753
MAVDEKSTLLSVDFEIFGKVQGVFFRKFTQKESQRLGLVGWVRNTPQNSVDGQIQGPREQVELMNAWLQTKGSDKSRIDKACFTHERTLDALEFTQFKIVK